MTNRSQFAWMGLASSDPDRARSFYGALFGWRGEDTPGGAYTVLRRGDRSVAILYSQTPEARRAGVRPHWTAFLAVEDAAAAAARVVELGGRLVRAPFEVAGGGRIATVGDPCGTIFSLWQAAPDGRGALHDESGALCWSELRVPDAERAGAFYGRLLGLEHEAGEHGELTLKPGGRPIAGVRTAGAATPPLWLPHFKVEDAARAARAAEELGGRVLEPVRETRRGRVAVVADPEGAAFAVREPG